MPPVKVVMESILETKVATILEFFAGPRDGRELLRMKRPNAIGANGHLAVVTLVFSSGGIHIS